MKIALGAVLLFAALFAGCSKDSTVVGGDGGDGTGSNPNRQSPGKYTQSPLSIPSAINDAYYAGISGFTAAFGSSGPVTYLWSYDALNVFSQYQQLSLPQQEIVVAVIDTGVDKDHEDLIGRLWVNPAEAGDAQYNNGVDDDHDGFVDDYLGWDFVNNTNNPADDFGHGTHVAGTIAAIGDNAKGIIGVAPWVRIMALKVCDESGSCASEDIRAAIAYAVAHGAKIINLSLGAPDQGDDAAAFDAAITAATQAGVLVFAAAGNESSDASEMSPANATQAVAVAAYRNDGPPCSFSNYGWKVDLSAPGCALDGGFEVDGILSLNSKKCGSAANEYCSNTSLVGDGYTLKSGTSMSTPHASGLAAVAWTASPSATPLQIRQALLATARAAGSGAMSLDFGYGRASGTNLAQEAQRAPGIKITSPHYGTSAASQQIQFRVEARDTPVQWALRYIKDAGLSQATLSSGTAIGTGGMVSAQTSVDLSQTWSPPSSGNYLVVLEATVSGLKYYDTTLLSRP